MKNIKLLAKPYETCNNKFFQPKIPNFQDVTTARERIRLQIHKTPIFTSTHINQMCGAELYFKCENFQKTGVFKVRGAINAVFGLSEEKARNGVATHSSGNHALSLSYAAMRRGIRATVVVPQTTPQAKKDAVRGYGGRIIECEPSTASREKTLAEFIDKSAAEFIHPYNDPWIIAGQATCSLELYEQVENLEAVIAPIGGGSMVAGTCLALSSIASHIRIYAAEPQAANDAQRSFKAGHIISADAPHTIADGLRSPLKELTWHFVSKNVTDIFTATDQEIIEAMKLIWRLMKIIVEPSSAVPLAVILKNKDVFRGERVGLILTGGNVDFVTFFSEHYKKQMLLA